jgi:hypothetical protein
MIQSIDPVKLKASAENLEWVLKQYPDSEDVQSLLRSLTPLIEDAKAGRVSEPVDGTKIPGSWNFGDGRYIPYKNPSIGGAYADFVIEMEGGLTEQDKRRLARMDAMRQTMIKDSKP